MVRRSTRTPSHWYTKLPFAVELIQWPITGCEFAMLNGPYNSTPLRLAVGALLAALMISLPALAGEDPPKNAPPESATVEKIMQQAVRNISRRYNLNEAQTEKTQEIMQREVHRFLREHENEVWPLIRDLLASQLGAKPPSNVDEVKRIGKAARPLAQLAREAIYRGNSEWRMYLTPEQKSTHDYDLGQMEETF